MTKDERCKCTFTQSLVGDGCRYCQPQDFIDRLLDDLKDCDERIDELEMKEWQGLTDNEKLASIRKWAENNTMRGQELIGLCDAIEQSLKEKNA